MRTIKITKNLNEISPPQHHDNHDNASTTITNKIIRTSTTPPNTVSNIISSMASTQPPQIQNITKKSLNISTISTTQSKNLTSGINNSNILNAINLAASTATLSSSYVASCSGGSGSSQINLPTTTPITKCSQTLATPSQNPSSSSTSSNSTATLGPSTTAKLILTGSVSALPTNGNNLIIETKPIINHHTLSTANIKTTIQSHTPQTQKILVSAPRFTTPNNQQSSLSSTPLTLSTTPINIKSLNSSKLNDTLNKSSIIIDTKRNSSLTNFVKAASKPYTSDQQQQQQSQPQHITNSTNISHMQISQLLNQLPHQRLNITSTQPQQQQQPPSTVTVSPMKPNIIRKNKLNSFDELSVKKELEQIA